MEQPSLEAGKRAGVKYAEVFYRLEEWDHVPGLRDYLTGNARAK